MITCVSILNLNENSFIEYEGGKYNGEIYKDKNLPHGYGRLILQNKDEYRGNFLFGKKNGNGELYFKNGDYYLGNFKDDLFDGFGKMEYKNGSLYKGNFFKGKRHGKGQFKGNKGLIKDGIWEKNIFIA